MADKFIPSGDARFATKAQVFARVIAREPQRFGIAREDAERFVRLVEDFHARLRAASNKFTCSRQTLMQKDEARDKARRVMEKLGRIIRANDELSRADRVLVGIPQRPAKLSRSRCPQTRPQLSYGGARHGKRVGRKVHVLRVKDPLCSRSMAKPAGARGVEIFVELLEEHERVPKHPGELSGGRPWYLRSFTRGPIEVEFPIADRPMRVVYWARWVGSTGDHGPFSQTCVAEFEGPAFAHKALVDQAIARRRQQSVIITTARLELPGPIEAIDALPGAAERLLPGEAA